MHSRVNRLIRVPNHKQAACIALEQSRQSVLRLVGVLLKATHVAGLSKTVWKHKESLKLKASEQVQTDMHQSMINRLP